MQTNPWIVLGIWVLVAAAGCVGHGPRMSSPADVLLEIQNPQSRTLRVEAWVAEPYGDTRLASREYNVPPSSTVHDPIFRVPAGVYELGARADDLERVVEVHVAPDSSYYRFVIHSDVIGFQQGDATP